MIQENQKLIVKNVSFNKNNNQILSNINFYIKPHNIIGIIGENGSGKSTLLNIISGILKTSSGKVIIDGLEYFSDIKTDLKIRREKLSIVIQDSEEQIIGSTIKEDIAFGLENKCCSKEYILNKIDKLSKKFKIEHILERPTHDLSGGEKQLCCICSAVAMDTRYYIFDEPTSQLDPVNKSIVIQNIVELKKEGKGIIVVTHNIEDIINFDYILIIKNGKINGIYKPFELFRLHKEVFLENNLLIPTFLKYLDKLKDNNLIDDNIYTFEDLKKSYENNI